MDNWLLKKPQPRGTDNNQDSNNKLHEAVDEDKEIGNPHPTNVDASTSNSTALSPAAKRARGGDGLKEYMYTTRPTI